MGLSVGMDVEPHSLLAAVAQEDKSKYDRGKDIPLVFDSGSYTAQFSFDENVRTPERWYAVRVT